MELKVGMYARTKNEIVQIDKISNGVMEDTKGHLHFGDFIKASHNIIDLIEVGDYVNGIKIKKADNAYRTNTFFLAGGVYKVDDDLGREIINDNNALILEEDIKSIVTKEQFEAMEYRLGDE